MKIVYFIIVFSTCLTTNVYAYLDPGTGSFFLKVLLLFFQWFQHLHLFSEFFKKIKLKKFFKKKNQG